MNFLVAHDRENVLNDIVDVLIAAGFSRSEIDCVKDGTSARRAMQKKSYDLFIIDLTLPHIHGVDAPSFQTSDLLLQELFRLEDLFVPGDIIGITLDRHALERIQNSIGPYIMALVEEDKAGTWRKHLTEKIIYVSRAARSRQFSISSQFDCDALIVTALDEELSPYKRIFEFNDFSRFPGTYTFAFGDKRGKSRQGVAFSVGKSGVARAASYTQSLLSIFRPRLALMSGICGGPEGKTKLGDVVIADSSIDWDYGKWIEPETGPADSPREKQSSPIFLSRPGPLSIVDTTAHRVARSLVESDYLTEPTVLRSLAQNSEGKITKPSWHLAPMASGSAVIGSQELNMRIRGLNDSIRGIDMECFGFYHAALKTHVVKPEVMCIKAVSDFGNGSKGDDYHEGCAYLSAIISAHIITKLWVYPD